MLNVVDIQEAVLSHLRDSIPQPVIEQGIPDSSTVARDPATGKVITYVSLQFGDLQERYQGKTFVGNRHDDYDLIMYTQVVSPDPATTRRVASENVMDAMLGFETDWASHVRKRPGGGMWALTQSNGATEAYMFPGSWAITFQMNPS